MIMSLSLLSVSAFAIALAAMGAPGWALLPCTGIVVVVFAAGVAGTALVGDK